MGDGVLVYFGYPQAHEDDAERATLGSEFLAVVAEWKRFYCCAFAAEANR
jgi:class 3 adenylate cyclase